METKLRKEIGRRNIELTKIKGTNLMTINKIGENNFKLGIQNSNFTLVGTAEYILAFLNVKLY